MKLDSSGILLDALSNEIYVDSKQLLFSMGTLSRTLHINKLNARERDVIFPRVYTIDSQLQPKRGS